MAELIFKEEVYNIIGAAMEVHSILGPGFLEPVYQEALAIEFRERELPFTEKPHIKIDYKHHVLESVYIPDFICYNQIIIELKALKKCGEIEEAQILNEIKASKHKLGLLINFGEPSLYWKRYVY